MAYGKWFYRLKIKNMNEAELRKLLNGILPPCDRAMREAALRQQELAKPPGSLGRLEDISIQLAGITGKLRNKIEHTRVIVFAADNGIVSEGVASTPQSVTLSQSINMTHHITGMSSIAACFGTEVEVIDVGIASTEVPPSVLNKKIRLGTRNFAFEPAMTCGEVLDALSVGIDAVKRAKTDAIDAIGIGEMGIGNTTTSAAVLAALTGEAVENVTGRGSGLTDQAFELKKKVISNALALHSPDANDPIDVLCKVGGLDIAAMTGAYIGCAYYRIPAVIDGLISVTAALVASRLSEGVKAFLFPSHASVETGCRIAEAELGIKPWLLLNMRLGEGSGCPLSFQIMRAACAAMNAMATFDEAAINNTYLEGIRSCSAFGSAEESEMQ